ncbi:Hypp6181 [Branchiostoma lanceolatum]|uniref:Hypp6181 protein n=1 Tax=Branchiostoma lanceolatum TaxID=7740 RepID=A0A8J9VU14_BRALA|nr:Hypp6181 [Branchiostoma lanceolatum]
MRGRNSSIYLSNRPVLEAIGDEIDKATVSVCDNVKRTDYLTFVNSMIKSVLETLTESDNPRDPWNIIATSHQSRWSDEKMKKTSNKTDASINGMSTVTIMYTRTVLGCKAIFYHDRYGQVEDDLKSVENKLAEGHANRQILESNLKAAEEVPNGLLFCLEKAKVKGRSYRMRNRKGLPQAIKEVKLTTPKEKICMAKGPLLALKNKYRRDVKMLSTAHSAKFVRTGKRNLDQVEITKHECTHLMLHRSFRKSIVKNLITTSGYAKVGEGRRSSANASSLLRLTERHFLERIAPAKDGGRHPSRTYVVCSPAEKKWLRCRGEPEKKLFKCLWGVNDERKLLPSSRDSPMERS